MSNWLRAVLMTTAVAALVISGFLGWEVWQDRVREQALQRATETATSFLEAWETGDYSTLSQLTTASDGAAVEVHRTNMEQLAVDRVEIEHTEPTLNDPDDIAAGAVVPFEVTLHLQGLGAWTYDSRLPLQPDGEGEAWQVEWSPAVLHPDMTGDTQLERTRTWPDRAPVLSRDGDPLSDTGTTLGRVVGHVDEVTEEQLGELGAPYRPGDPVGQRGLQRAFQDQLAGSPTGEVQLIDADGEVVEVLRRFEGRPPEPLRTTLDVELQRAAEEALGVDMPPSSLVILDAGTSEIRAVVDRPASGFMRSLAGQYAPGSTFKLVTAAALLRGGLELDTPVDCPKTATVGGRRFGNFEDMDLGEIPFRRAIYESCNTAFVQQAAELEQGAIDTTAEDFGFDVDHELAVGATIAQYPQPADLAERVAAAIGQGRVLATPTHMASVAAAVSAGRWQAPTLIRDDSDRPVGDIEDVAGALAEAMREVPLRGTAADAGLPEGVAGKTGTAEVGTAQEGEDPPTNAWFIGFADVGDEQLAFAVLVEGGESGGSVAAPVAARLLHILRDGR